MTEQQPHEPADIARDLLACICQAFFTMKEEQNHLFVDLGYRLQDRFDLSIQLAQTLYRSGLGTDRYPKQVLQHYISEGELQAILYLLVCGDTTERIVSQSLVPLLRRPDFNYYATRELSRYEQQQQDQPGRPRRQSAPSGGSSQEGETEAESGEPDLPTVSERNWSARRGTHARRSGRSPGRTGWRDDRGLPTT